jgi:stage V sporulation protein SpoVS
MHVSGKNKTEAELQAIGQTVMNRILQQYAYQRVMEELEKRGFTVVKEEVDENQVIRIRVRKPA